MCPCGDGGHATYGACLRAKNLRVAYCASWRGHDLTAEKAKDRECDDYRRARAEGIQPGGSSSRAIQYAVSQSDRHGRAFDAAHPLRHLPED